MGHDPLALILVRVEWRLPRPYGGVVLSVLASSKARKMLAAVGAENSQLEWLLVKSTRAGVHPTS